MNQVFGCLIFQSLLDSVLIFLFSTAILATKITDKIKLYWLHLPDKKTKVVEFQVLLSGANLNMSYGRRYGLVGRNGLGKSTLLRTISKRQLIIPRHISILHVEQEVVGDDTLALQSVLESFTRREDLLKEEKTINAALAEG